MPIEIEHAVKGDIVEIPRQEFERLRATLELLEDEDLKAAVLKGLEEYREGRSRRWSEVRGEL